MHDVQFSGVYLGCMMFSLVGYFGGMCVQLQWSVFGMFSLVGCIRESWVRVCSV